MTEDHQDPNTTDSQPTNPEPAEVVPAMPDESEGWRLVERAAWHLLEKKAEDLVALDLRGRSDVCDFFLLASGTSTIQTKALAKHLQDTLLTAGHRPKGLEGLDEGRWALLDFFDVVVHVFVPDAREYFQLERLWGDAPRLDLDPAWFAREDVQQRHPDVSFNMTAGGAPAADQSGKDG